VWKQAQEEVRQCLFIDSYIAAYIQVQNRVTGVNPTGLTVARGCRQVSTVLALSSGLGREENRSEVQPLWRCLLMGRVLRLWHL
jgi:hypothetical protein